MINKQKLVYNLFKTSIKEVAEIKTTGNITPDIMENLLMMFLTQDDDELNKQKAAAKVLVEEIIIPDGKPASFKLAIKISKENVYELAKIFEFDPTDIKDMLTTLPLLNIETGISLSVVKKSDQVEIPVNLTLIDGENKDKSSKISLRIGLSLLNSQFLKNIILNHISTGSFMKTGSKLYGEDPSATIKTKIENALMAHPEKDRDQLRINTYKKHGIVEWVSFEERIENIKKAIESFFSAEDVFENIKKMKTTVEFENQKNDLIVNFNYTHTLK